MFGYVSNVYSSRKLETACRENINFMWLSGTTSLLPNLKKQSTSYRNTGINQHKQ
ncbi:transposase [Sphingobacterium thalpophilum]|uniref:transposase n=1 Tax=Sphingobacterium thalpophilum TaxID=259 RepID=UPI0037D99307